MTDEAFDKLLRAALLQAQARRWQPALQSGPELVWDSAHAPRMERVCKEPFGYGKRHARPAWSRVLRRVAQAAACLVLVVSLTLAVSPAARAWATRVLRIWFPDNVEYRFTGTGQSEPTRWRPTYLPEGYSLVDTFAPTLEYTTLTYENADGIYINITCNFVTEGSGILAFDNEHSDVTTAEVNGIRADLYVTNTPGWPSYLIWMDEAANTAFLVFGEVDTAELIRVGESLEKVP